MVAGVALGCGVGKTAETIAIMTASMDCMETLLTSRYGTQ
jgi:hypothetical protein